MVQSCSFMISIMTTDPELYAIINQINNSSLLYAYINATRILTVLS